MVDLTFDKTDLERLVRDDWKLVCGHWKQADVIGQWLTIKDDGLNLSDGLKNNPVWTHSAGDQVLPLPKFTLAQFKAFCDWHPTFEWEAITSVFTNDDGTLDVVALAELESRGRAAGALVRGVLVGPDDEYLKAWEAHCRIDECKEEIDALRKLKPVTITERMLAKQELETLEARLAELLKPATNAAEPEVPPAPQPMPVVQPEAHAATALRETPMSRAGLVKAHIHHWPTIEADLKDAARNGLSVAKAGERNWAESKALEWARAKGKLTDQPGASSQPPLADTMAAHYGQLAGLPRQTHTL